MKDPTFYDRVKVAGLSYAQYLNLQAGNPRSKQVWVQQTVMSPDVTATQLVNPVVLNPNVQAAGAAVTDADLQAAVQAVADSMM